MPGNQEQRHVCFDRDLGVEAYRLSGVVQKFPNHFHEFYVIGFIEGGKRHLWCRDREYGLLPGDLILFNPRDNHCCAPVDGEALDYRALNIQPGILAGAAKEILVLGRAPRFTRNVAEQSEASALVAEVYDAILADAPRFQKERAFRCLLERVLQDFAALSSEVEAGEPDGQIQKLCAYMEQHFAENIALDDLLSMTSFGKSYLIRSFTRQVGVSPYRYLQTIRIGRAKQLLEQGVEPAEAAVLAGFSDQSHFSNFFKSFIGLTPKQYQRIFTETPACTGKEPGHEA